jgi:hypothetical protein
VRRVLALVVLASVSTAVALACSTFSSSPDAPDASPDAPTSTPPPAPPPAPADAGFDGTVFYDDFENGDCSAYSGYVANVLASDVAYGGKHACMICRTGDGGRPQASRFFDAPAAPGRYVLSFQAKLLEAGPPRGATASFILGYDAGDQSFTGDAFQIGSAAWLLVTHADTSTLPNPIGSKAVVIGDVASPDGECMVFDDVKMTYEAQ